MTPQELREDADKAAQEFAAQIASQMGETTGIPKPPTIEVSTSELPPEVFNFELDPQTEAQALPGGGGGPPEPPPEGCPCSLKVTFHDVILDCGCTPGDSGGGNRFLITDVNFNANPIYLFHSPCDGGCFWWDKGDDPLVIHEQRFFDVDCLSFRDEFDTPPNDVWVAHIGSFWYVWVTHVNSLIFFGTAASIASPINNTLSCTPTFSDYSNAGFDCAYFGPRSFNVTGHGGNVTIELPGTCGACCFPPSTFCVDGDAAACAAQSGGVFQGAGTACAPGDACP